MKVLVVLLMMCFLKCANSGFSFTSKESASESANSCFCKLHGYIDDCSCSVDTVDYYNNEKIYPRINSLLHRDYFKFYQVNLKRECPYWPDDSKCAIRYCSIQTCSEENVPEGLKHSDNEDPAHKYSEEAQIKEQDCDDKLGSVDGTISESNAQDFVRWKEHDKEQEKFCDVGDEHEADLDFVDLELNPERFTGYKGASAHRIWNSIYKENCFKPKKGKEYGPLIDSPDTEGLCLEERAFYRAISGLHASINIHLSAKYLLQDEDRFSKVVWGSNLNEFKKRFSAETTQGEGPQWLKNLYFVYLLELGALAKAAPYLEQQNFFTGSPAEDDDVVVAVVDILNIVKSFPDHFNTSLMFQSKAAEKLKADFRSHFLNISRIMDCVGCEKCKLWGKLQTHGLGTAMKILFSESANDLQNSNDFSKSSFKLSRNEIVALFNAFGRLSNSIYALEKFRQMLS